MWGAMEGVSISGRGTSAPALGRPRAHQLRPRLDAVVTRVTDLGRRHAHITALVMFVVVFGGIYSSVLDGSRSLITNGPWSSPLFVIDPAAGGLITAPLTRLAAVSWLHLQLPIVDPFQAYGVPLLANQGVPVYPPQLIAHLLFPGNYSVWLVVNLIALAFGVYLLARALGLSFAGAMAAGLLASLAGPAPPNVNASLLNPFAVLPFVLLAVRYAVDPASVHRRAALLGTATSVALLCLSGFQEVLPLMAVVIAVYSAGLVVHCGTWRRPRHIASTAAAAAAGCATGIVGILPSLSAIGIGLNGTSYHTFHFPLYWLSTLTLPTITGHAINAGPLNLGPPVNILGTPLLVVVVVLAAVLAARRQGAGTRWYVLPSLTLVVFGVMAYANVGHVLDALDLPLFDRIDADRYLQFAWWIPLCLLLGAVISNARVLKWRDAIGALLAAGVFDAYFFERFRQALGALHVPGGADVASAPFIAAAVMIAFIAAMLSARKVGVRAAGVLMALIVLASTVYDLPTNFAPSADGNALTSVRVPGPLGLHGTQLVLFAGDTRQLPTQQFSVQLYGPLVPEAYRVLVGRLFSKTETSGLGALYPAAQTLARIAWTPRAISVLRSIGVNTVVLSKQPASVGTAPIRHCEGQHIRPQESLCYLGTVAGAAGGVGDSPPTDYVYQILGAHPLVQPTARLVAVPSAAVALRRFSNGLSSTVTRIPRTAYVTTTATSVHAARGVTGISRSATAEAVSITVHSDGSGLAVLREAYERGMGASVNGRHVTPWPVDGGLWTAVSVRPGTSRVVLDYASTADVVELALAAGGLALLALLWVGLGLRRRKSRREVLAKFGEPFQSPRDEVRGTGTSTTAGSAAWYAR